jgi:hypothetical protein
MKSSSEADSMGIALTLAKKSVPSSTANDFFMRKLGLMVSPTGGPQEEAKFNKYILQLKEECAQRLVKTVYANEGMDVKFWLGFGRRPFLGQKFDN